MLQGSNSSYQLLAEESADSSTGICVAAGCAYHCLHLVDIVHYKLISCNHDTTYTSWNSVVNICLGEGLLMLQFRPFLDENCLAHWSSK